jgi:CRISPR-associated protein Csm2
MWNDELSNRSGKDKDAEYERIAPFIKMMCAMVAYAKGRGHVGNDFANLFSDVIKAVKNPTTLKHAKLFMEAIMGFYKAQGK